MACPHYRKQGDNYRMWCNDCGETLEWYND